MVGEWSLGGHGTYLKKLEPEALERWYQDFAKAQLQGYEQSSMGWVYWSYKTIYKGSPWNYREMCERGRLPGCSSDFQYSTNDWWSTHPCSFAYFDQMHDGQSCPVSSEPHDTFI